MKYQSDAATCSTKVQWSLCFCKGCNCSPLSSMQVLNDMDHYTNHSFCNDWYQRVDEAVRVYVSTLRGMIMSRKLACCAPNKKKKMQNSDRFCYDEELSLKEDSAPELKKELKKSYQRRLGGHHRFRAEADLSVAGCAV